MSAQNISDKKVQKMDKVVALGLDGLFPANAWLGIVFICLGLGWWLKGLCRYRPSDNDYVKNLRKLSRKKHYQTIANKTTDNGVQQGRRIYDSDKDGDAEESIKHRNSAIQSNDNEKRIWTKKTCLPEQNSGGWKSKEDMMNSDDECVESAIMQIRNTPPQTCCLSSIMIGKKAARHYEAGFKLVVSLIGVILEASLCASKNRDPDFAHYSVYTALMVSALIDALLGFSVLLPPGIDVIGNAIVFLGMAITYRAQSFAVPKGAHLHVSSTARLLQSYVAALTTGLLLIQLLLPRSLIIRSILCTSVIMTGVWLWQTASILNPWPHPEKAWVEHEHVNIMFVTMCFSWQLIGSLIFITIVFFIYTRICRQNSVYLDAIFKSTEETTNLIHGHSGTSQDEDFCPSDMDEIDEYNDHEHKMPNIKKQFSSMLSNGIMNAVNQTGKSKHFYQPLSTSEIN